MPTEPPPLTVARAVHRAVEVCEIGELDEPLEELLLRFEDDDEPIHAVENIELRIDESLGAIDPDWEQSGSLSMARSVVVYLAYRRDEIDADAEELLRLAARAEFAGHPPPPVAQWLQLAGIAV
ncbi:MAG: hypothetical protein QOK19_1221 [Solirubrobacteraceae bacterium]|jgi:hypothetical protein|nr:hypothetical protein [Solirubrobacterales bacterium]MEA2215660.1 hypothetical protein [Solirubrobacteraceae bacterium]